MQHFHNTTAVILHSISYASSI